MAAERQPKDREWRIEAGQSEQAGVVRSPSDVPARAPENTRDLPHRSGPAVPISIEEYDRLKSKAKKTDIPHQTVAQVDPSATED